MKNEFSDISPLIKTLMTVISLSVIALLTYSNSFNAPFVFDDRHNILENPYIRMTDISAEALTRTFKSPSAGRPLANLSFAADFFFHHYDLPGYHAFNLAVHIITALLIWLLTRQTLRLCYTENNDVIAFFAALLWLVNPLHTQSVTYIVQRMNSLAALFYLLAMICYNRARTGALAGDRPIKRRLLYGACLTAAVLGLAAKEIVATLPLTILLYEWFFFQDLDRRWLKKQWPWMGLAAAAIIALALLFTAGAPFSSIRSMYEKQTFTMGQRLLTEAGVVVYYLSLLFFPHPARLTVDYDFPVSHSLVAPLSTLPAMVALIMLVIGAVYAARRQRLPAFAVFWFLITLAVESSFLGLYLIFEHRTYLPSVFPMIALIWIIFTRSRAKGPVVAFLCLAVAVCGIWTYQRNAVRAEAVSLWRDAAQKAPGKARPFSNLGFSLLLAGKAEEAIAPLSRGLELNPCFQDIYSTIAIAFYLTGDTAKAIQYCRQGLELNPDFIEARNTLGYILRKQGRLDQAEDNFRQVLVRQPDNFEAIMNLGLIKQQQEDTAGALKWFQKAVDINPVSSRALYYLGVCQALAERPAEAVLTLQAALRLNPQDDRTHCALADLLQRQGDTETAVDHYERALAIAPSRTAASLNLARLLIEKGETAKGMAYLDEAVRQSPQNTPLIWQVVLLLTEAGRYRSAAEHLENLAALHPGDPKLFYNLACLYALQNETERAVTALKQAVNNGYDDWSRIRTDKDLENISDTPYYRQLTQKQRSQ